MRLWCLHGNFGLPNDFDCFQNLWSIGKKAIELKAPALFQDTLLNNTDSLEAWTTRFSEHVASIQNASLCGALGYSLGGRLALNVLCQRPEIFRFAILVSTRTCVVGDEAKKARLLHDAQWARKLRDPNYSWERILTEWNAQPVFAKDKVPMDRKESDFDREKIAAAFEAWSVAKMEVTAEALSEIGIPVLWIFGEEDAGLLTERRYIETLGKRNFSFVIVPSVGHRVPWERQRFFVEIVQGFLDKFQ